MWVAIAVLAALAVVTAPAVSRAQGAPTDTTAADTTGTDITVESPFQRAARGAGIAYQLPDTLEAATNVGIRFSPIYLNQIRGDVSTVGMKNSMQTNIITPFNSVFNFMVSADETHYRLQESKFDESKRLSASLLHTFNIFTNGTASFLESRVFNRSLAPGGIVQDYILNDTSINAGGAYQRAHQLHSGLLKSIRLDAIASGAAVLSERTYKDDQTLAAGAFGGFAADLRRRHVRISGRGGHRETWDRSETTLATFNDLGSTEDSLSAGLIAEVGDSIFIDAGYIYYEGDRSWADQAQGSFGGQQGGVQNVFQEYESRSSRGALVSVDAKVLRHFQVAVTAFHDSQLNDYAVQQTRYSNTVSDGLRGTLTYRTPWRTQSTISLENSETLRDLGPLSVSSFNDIRKKAGIVLSHSFTPTLSLNLAGNTQLTRQEYITQALRDRDQVDTSVNLRLSSTPFPNLTAGVSAAYSSTDFINIDASQSDNNRYRELYEFRPGFTFNVSNNFKITQLYGIAIEYTDYDYEPTQNFLDRNLTFGNTFDFRPTGRVGFIFDYAYTFHDNGSYLPDPVTGQEELTVQGEDRRDRFNLKMQYLVMNRSKTVRGENLTQTLTVFADERYSRFEDRSLLSNTTSVTTDGQIMVGGRGDYGFGSGRTLVFSLARVKRFGGFGSEKEKNFWDMRSEFNYPF